MNKALTLDEILLYSLEEPDELSDDAAMENLLNTYDSFNEEYQLLDSTRKMIDDSMVSPPDSVISKIIAYSKALTVLSLSEPDLRKVMKN
mgnify:CR=1 FL=1